MKSCIILTHQFIAPDTSNRKKYGSAGEWGGGDEWKEKVFDFCIEHHRRNNPNDFIIVTGHGKKPSKNILDKADQYYWSEDIIEGEINYGHPFLVSKGLSIARENRIEYACKTRIDTVNLIKNINEYCKNKLDTYNKRILNTWYCKNRYLLMDLFNYGSVEDLTKLYEHEDWKVEWSIDGTGPVAKNYVTNILKKDLQFPFDQKKWHEMVNQEIYFCSPDELRWIDLRKHNHLVGKNNKDLNENNFDKLKNYTWRHY